MKQNNNWRTKKIGDFSKIINGNSINEKVKEEKYLNLEEGYPYVATKDIGFDGSINYENGVRIPFEEKSFKLADAQTILICSEGGSAGRKIAFNTRKIAFVNKLFAVKIDSDLDSRYLYYYFLSDKFQDEFSKRKTGLIGGVSLNKFKDINIFFPSLSEQKRIVKKLDEVFENIEKAKENTEKNLQNSYDLFESYLQEVMNLTNSERKNKKLGDICTFQGGSQPSKNSFIYQDKEGYIRLIQIRDYKSDKHIVYIQKEKARRFCRVDDVMIGRYGPPLFQILRGLEGAYNVALMKAIPDEKEIVKDYLYFFLKNKNIQDYVISQSSRSVGQTGVNKQTLEPYPISYPSISEQKIIIKNLNKLLEKTKELEEIYKQKLADLEELKKSILAEAFAGRL